MIGTRPLGFILGAPTFLGGTYGSKNNIWNNYRTHLCYYYYMDSKNISSKRAHHKL